MADRDTKFLGFARLLTQEIEKLNEELSDEKNNIVDGCMMCNWPLSKISEALSPIIAQRAYDLAIHTICEYDDTSRAFALEMIDHVPDLTQWPPTE